MGVSGLRTQRQDSARSGMSADPWLLVAAVALLVVGLMAIYSSTVNQSGAAIFKKQVTNLFIGLIPAAIVWKVTQDMWKKASNLLYIANLVLLGLVLFAGETRKGAQRWISFGALEFQPSELTKLLIIVTLATFYANRRELMNQWWTPAVGFLHVVPSLLLLKAQPHLSSVMVVCVIWFAVTIASGAQARHIWFTVVGLFASLVVLNLAGVVELRGYQEDRLKAMTKTDLMGADFQQHQAAMAFGKGGVFGTGYLKGEQKTRVPEQHNDFIFSVIGEEGGLVVCTMVLGLFGLLYFRIWMVSALSGSSFGRMAAAGVLAVLAFHTFINLGMNLQILPVAGLWLPFLSYGGTALWLCMMCIALVQSIYRQDQENIFK